MPSPRSASRCRSSSPSRPRPRRKQSKACLSACALLSACYGGECPQGPTQFNVILHFSVQDVLALASAKAEACMHPKAGGPPPCASGRIGIARSGSLSWPLGSPLQNETFVRIVTPDWKIRGELELHWSWTGQEFLEDGDVYSLVLTDTAGNKLFERERTIDYRADHNKLCEPQVAADETLP